MKTFSETTAKVKEVTEDTVETPTNFPTFSQVVHNEVAEGFTGKDDVSTAFEKLHALQLELQKLQTQMLETRTKFMSFAKEAPQRKTIAADLIGLSKKKNDLVKKISDAEVVAQRALASDTSELEDLDVL